MMGRLLLLIALIALSAAVPTKTADAVVPESKFDHRVAFSQMSPTDFIQAMSKAGNTEGQCREFATDTLADITATVTSSQTTMDAIDTGASCAGQGQDAVAAAQAIVDTKAAALVAGQAAAATALSTKTTTCTAGVDLPTVNLDVLKATTCYDYTTAASYTAANQACTDAIAALANADQAVIVQQTEKTDAETALAADQAEASRLVSGCLCDVHKEQKAAWTAVESATASHEAEWQQAQHILCALDSTLSTCSVPACPSVTKPTVANGVANADTEHCTEAPSTAPTTAPTDAPTTAPTRPPARCTMHMAGHTGTAVYPHTSDTGFNGGYDNCGGHVYTTGDCASRMIYDNDNDREQYNFGASSGTSYISLPYDLSSDCAGWRITASPYGDSRY